MLYLQPVQKDRVRVQGFNGVTLNQSVPGSSDWVCLLQRELGYIHTRSALPHGAVHSGKAREWKAG